LFETHLFQEHTMYIQKALKHYYACIFCLMASGMALAHPGHGAGTASHWHATDGWGLLVGGALALALWWGRKP
jgi:hypothetical protein